jgi:hypothetical protein
MLRPETVTSVSGAPAASVTMPEMRAVLVWAPAIAREPRNRDVIGAGSRASASGIINSVHPMHRLTQYRLMSGISCGVRGGAANAPAR